MIHQRQVVKKRKGSKLRRTTFQSQLDLKLEGVGLEDLQSEMSSIFLSQCTIVIKPGKAINGLDTEKLLNSRTCGLHHLIFLLHLKQVFCYW